MATPTPVQHSSRSVKCPLTRSDHGRSVIAGLVHRQRVALKGRRRWLRTIAHDASQRSCSERGTNLYQLLRAMATVLALVAISAQPVNAADTPTMGQNGDCWQAGTPLWCIQTWAGRSHYVYYRAWDNFSGAYPTWLAPAQAAVNAWNSAPGPQYYSFASGQTLVYLNPASTGQVGLGSGNTAVTWECISSGCFSDYTKTGIWQWFYIYLNTDVFPNETAAQKQNTVAHESGHAMGLWHNSSSSTLMYPALTTIPGPTSSDIGAYRGCSSGGHGVNCVFGWGD